jgi:radical SAM protein with 4Fe4S-binding SPASM domain
LIPFFPLKVRKGQNYEFFNPLDLQEYELNYDAYRILEMCDGISTPREIAERRAGESGESPEESMAVVGPFLDDMYRSSFITGKADPVVPYRGYPPPSTVFLEITGRCNLRCAHCLHPDEEPRGPELTTDEVFRVSEELASAGVKGVVIGGGEPLARRDFRKILSHIAARSLAQICVVSNGTLITKQIARSLAENRAGIQISIDGDTPALHDQMRGVPGAFDKAIRGLRYLIEAGVDPEVCATVTSRNAVRILQIRSMVRGLGVTKFRVQRVVGIGRGRSNGKELIIPPAKMKALVERLEQERIPVSSFGFTLTTPPDAPVDLCGSGTCSAGTTSCAITSDGTVIPCSYFWGFAGENIRDHSFSWIWEHSAVLRYFRSIRLKDINGVCQNCKWLSTCCGGCKAENYASGDLFNSSPTCWVADELRQKLPAQTMGQGAQTNTSP